MQTDLFDTSELIKKNNLQEVTDPMMFVKGSIPSSGGLLSTDIFGVSMKDRKDTYAYIDLHMYFLHPYIYKLLKRINRNFESLVHGSKKFIIENGDIVEHENGDTGLGFLYKNWEKLKFESTDIGGGRELRVNVLKNYTKKELFTRYWIIVPAFYRDVNFENMDKGSVSHRSEINDKYTKLIRLAAMLTSDSNFDFMMISTQAKLQDTLVEIYDFLKGKIAKKEGMIRRNLLGKSVDYGSRCVISAPTFKAEKPTEMEVDFDHCGVPLAHCCSLFNPFIVAWVRNFFRQKFETSSNKLPGLDSKGNIIYYEADNPELYFTDELIKKEIDNFIKNFNERFKPIEVPVKGDKKFVNFSFVSRIYNKNNPLSESNIINRNATWCDILYQAAVAVTADKVVYITRYPIADYFSIFPNKIFVMSTNETEAVIIDETVYEHYPKIDLSKPPSEVATSFIDTVRMSNLYLKGLGGDYDGDQISIRGVFSQEATQEALELMKSKSRIISIHSNNMRESSNEAIQTLYSLTKF